ncbi:MAG: 50S ribosome-binding GTPase, partial [Thermoproteus sp.]|nr:50S ribosome-binding GTPase [Thermoproteus sp.]
MGPPNVGKSTLFYAMTGRYVKTANYPGKTLGLEVGVAKRNGVVLEIVDLPGVFDPANPKDEDERIALKEALEGRYDAVVVVGAPHAVKEAAALAEHVGRSRPVVFVFNMVDVGAPLVDRETLEREMGVPVFYTSAAKRRGVSELLDFLAKWEPAGATPPKAVDIPVGARARTASALLSRPWAAALAFAALSLATVFLLLALMEGVTPMGDLPWSLSAPLDAALGPVSDAIAAAGLPPLLASLLEALWTGASALISFFPYVLVAMALVAFYEEVGLVGMLSRG